ncbi:tyrosine-type recombinase/integrase [Nocardia sp. NPDC059691]|uniref:tyrosine-type recombinase/integrase n=1 Tax=Nocardia sp. NPDC059691 TaxID=3346908 RepID=UPI00367EA10E
MTVVQIELPAYKVVTTTDPALPYVLVDEREIQVVVVADYLRELTASDCSPLTVKSYAFDLQGWFRFLLAEGVAWDAATRVQVRDYVLMLRSAENPQRRRATPNYQVPGPHPRTGKPRRGGGYAPATINHRLAVLSSFYEFAKRIGVGPEVIPVPGAGAGNRSLRHRSPLEPRTPTRRGSYRQKTGALVPRAIPDELYEEVFGSLTSDRDRAIVALLVSSGARASELLGMTLTDVDWGGQRIRLIGKGTRAPEWVAVSPDALLCLSRYLAGERPRDHPDPTLWLTLRKPYRPLRYQAMRAMLLRVNARLGLDLVLHDFRHTCGIRLASDPAIPITDVRAHLRHRTLASSEPYLVARPDDVIARVREHHHAPPTTPAPSPAVSWSYDRSDLTALLGPALS